MTTTTPPNFPKLPTGLRRGGKAIWESVREKGYVLRPDEARILEDACREADLADQLDAALRKDLRAGLFKVTGSMGQPVINPMIAEVRQHRMAAASLLARLKLPDVDSGSEGGAATPDGRGEQQRNAAQSRWAIPHQAG